MGRMTGGRESDRLLDAAHAAFIQGPVSVIVATRNAGLVPDVVRGCGCRVSRDRRQVTVLIEPARASSLLDDIAANGLVAVSGNAMPSMPGGSDRAARRRDTGVSSTLTNA